MNMAIVVRHLKSSIRNSNPLIYIFFKVEDLHYVLEDLEPSREG
jgi:hypothetical protein